MTGATLVRPAAARRRASSETPFGIHQVLAAAAPGDAITNLALELRDVLQLAVPSEIYAQHVAPELANEVRDLREFSRRKRGVLLHHASIGDAAITSFLRSRPEPLVLVYHNITPARYFQPWDPAFAELLELGREELALLRDRVELAIADSEFNAAELYELGYRDVRIVPPVIEPRRLVDLVPDPVMLDYLDTGLGMPFVLFVGQLAPHKRPDLLVEAAHVARTYFALDVTVLLVGPQRFRRYANAIIEQVRALNLPTVHVVGPVPDARLAAMFRRALAMVTVSEHEGFCVPLVEAMALDVPIVATANAAIPEVVGDAALLLPPSAGPALVAEALLRVREDEDLRRNLAARGRRRIARFDRDETRRKILASLVDFL